MKALFTTKNITVSTSLLKSLLAWLIFLKNTMSFLWNKKQNRLLIFPFPLRYTDDRPHHKCQAETHINDYDTPEIRCSLRNLSRVTEWFQLVLSDKYMCTSRIVVIQKGSAPQPQTIFKSRRKQDEMGGGGGKVFNFCFFFFFSKKGFLF